MQIWLDTADIAAIEQASKSGVLFGVTTNPSIFAAANKDADKLLDELLSVQTGLLAVQVTNIASADHMFQQGLALSKLSPTRIVIKVPSTPMGFQAMKQLKEKKKFLGQVLATGISTLPQFIAAATVKADYAALYLAHMQSAHKNIMDEVKIMTTLIKENGWTTNLMGAAFADTATAQAIMGAGVGSVTVPTAIFNELFAIEPQVLKQYATFEADWDKYQKNHQAGMLSNAGEPLVLS